MNTPEQPIKQIVVPTAWATIFIAGDYADAVRCCRNFCDEGLCVTIESTTYVYTRGAEAGVRVGLINYPRFPSTQEQLTDKALRLSDELRQALFQSSYSIMTPAETIWRSWRPE
jgi:hypothetical protein